MILFFFFSPLSMAYAEDASPGNDPNAPRDIESLLSGSDTGTGILGKTLFSGVNEDPRKIAKGIINVAMGFLGALMVSLIVYSGFLWMIARKEGEKVKILSAKAHLINAVIGAIIVFSAWTISIFVLDVLKETVKGGGGTKSSGLTVEQICISACMGKWSGCNGACTNACRSAKTLGGCECHDNDTIVGIALSGGCSGKVE